MDPKFLCLIIKVYSTSCPHSYRKPSCLVKRRIWVHRDLGSRSKSVFIWMNCFPGLSTGEKNTHNLKVENYVLFDRLSEDSKPGKQTASQMALKHGFKQVREEPGYLGVFATKTG